MKTLTEQQAVALLRERIVKSTKTEGVFAHTVLKMSASYLSDVLNGNSRMPRRALDHLGLERVNLIRRKRKG